MLGAVVPHPASFLYGASDGVMYEYVRREPLGGRQSAEVLVVAPNSALLQCDRPRLTRISQLLGRPDTPQHRQPFPLKAGEDGSYTDLEDYSVVRAAPPTPRNGFMRGGAGTGTVLVRGRARLRCVKRKCRRQALLARISIAQELM